MATEIIDLILQGSMLMTGGIDRHVRLHRRDRMIFELLVGRGARNDLLLRLDHLPSLQISKRTVQPLAHVIDLAVLQRSRILA
jgi:hypothetical protein